MDEMSREEIKKLVSKLFRDDPYIKVGQLLELIPAHPMTVLDVVLELKREGKINDDIIALGD